MTFFMLLLAMGSRTYVFMWMLSMILDTILLCGLMFLKYNGKI